MKENSLNLCTEPDAIVYRKFNGELAGGMAAIVGMILKLKYFYFKKRRLISL